MFLSHADADDGAILLAKAYDARGPVKASWRWVGSRRELLQTQTAGSVTLL